MFSPIIPPNASCVNRAQASISTAQVLQQSAIARTLDTLVDKTADRQHAAHRQSYTIRPTEHHAYGVEVVTPWGETELFNSHVQAERWIAERTAGTEGCAQCGSALIPGLNTSFCSLACEEAYGPVDPFTGERVTANKAVMI